MINQIIDDNKEYVDSKGIKRAFFKYHTKLFQGKKTNLEKIKTYLNNASLPKINEEFKAMLNGEIQREEISKAIEEIKLGKAPGPDGFTAKFYKKLKEELVPALELLMNDIRDTKAIPETWKEANIALIPKEGQDLTNVKNYRPISLLNNDYKIFAKIIAERVKSYLQNVISEEQAGFLPNRQIRDNLRIVMDAIEYYDKHPEKEVAFLFVDAEKAFDNLNWDFMFQVIDKMEIGLPFKNVIEAIYTEQRVKLNVNKELTDHFKV